MTDYIRLPLPMDKGPLFITPADGLVTIELEDGSELLSFESFDEYSGIECKDGSMIREWEQAESQERLRRAAQRSQS